MSRVSPLKQDPLRRWSIADALDTYHINRWGSGYVEIGANGNLLMTPRGPDGGTIDLKGLIDELSQRGIELPILVRFPDILRSRIELLVDAFGGAMAEYGYEGAYRGVYPLKVNQAQRVVQEVIEFGRPYHYGLEVGSKPELLAAMALHDNPEALIVCNGYKDTQYIETALLASKLGRTVVLVAEKPNEVSYIVDVSSRLGIPPTLGIRARLSSRGAGRWEQSAGDRSKFGLSAADIVAAVHTLRASNQLDCLRLLHFHLGSQISSIRSIKSALREAGRLFVELYKMGCSSLSYFDVGGGLGVDYDGSQTNFSSSMNYTVQEYANDVVYTMKEICDAAEVPHPVLVTEAGRAVAAHHSVLVVNVLGVSEFGRYTVPNDVPDDAHTLVRNLFDTYELVNRPRICSKTFTTRSSTKTRSCSSSIWAISRWKSGCSASICSGGPFSASRPLCAPCNRFPRSSRGWKPRSATPISATTRPFQSLPDARGPWASSFPSCRSTGSTKGPPERGILADITCDSDGKIDSFIDVRDVKKSLELHPVRRLSVLPGPLLGRRLPGDPGRYAQSLWRHQYGPCLAGERRQLLHRRGGGRRYRG